MDPRSRPGANQTLLPTPTAELRSKLAELGQPDWGARAAEPSSWELWTALHARWGWRTTLIDLDQLYPPVRDVALEGLPQPLRDLPAAPGRRSGGPAPAAPGVGSRLPETVAVFPLRPSLPSGTRRDGRGTPGPVGAAPRAEHVG